MRWCHQFHNQKRNNMDKNEFKAVKRLFKEADLFIPYVRFRRDHLKSGNIRFRDLPVRFCCLIDKSFTWLYTGYDRLWIELNGNEILKDMSCSEILEDPKALSTFLNICKKHLNK